MIGRELGGCQKYRHVTGLLLTEREVQEWVKGERTTRVHICIRPYQHEGACRFTRNTFTIHESLPDDRVRVG